MKRLLFFLPALVLASASFAQNSPQEESKQIPSIAKKTEGMQAFSGHFADYWDAREGRLLLRVDQWNTPFLFHESLPNGVGSNEIGLDRGQPGRTFVVHFERIGPRVFLVAENQDFRAVTDDPEQQRAVREAFAQSILWGFKVEAADGDDVLVDATDFFLSDVHQVAATLAEGKHGKYHVDPSRSAIYLPRTKNFPENTDVEATLTLVGDEPSEAVKTVTPDPSAITVHEHFSFIKAPPPGFHSRPFDPRAGYFDISYMDFASPVDVPIVQRYIARHRLAKKDPSSPVGEPLKPIIYYIDRAIPEPIRSAVLEGAGWWNQAFTAAGYKDAFQVRLLPPDADPMDIRYNVIEWVPRSTRGWSIGDAVVDPRTGEIIQGHVTLDALRIRQVFLIAQGLLNPFGKDDKALGKANVMALARIRQLAAHETGHTLGLMHNYAASLVDRASVMDYPPPTVTVDANGVPDVSDSYAVGIGAWDKVAINYGYRDLPTGSNRVQALDKILNDAFASGLLYLTDQDARPAGSASPAAHLWDTGRNTLDGLAQVLKVRQAALKNLSETAIREHTPMATLEDVLVPVYLYHRYQITAVAKSIGGLNYSFDLRGSVRTTPEIVPAAEQRKAIQAVLQTLSPEFLAVPERLLAVIPPRPPAFTRSPEDFALRTSPVFDSLAPADAAAGIVIKLLLQPERDQRMIEFHAREATNPGFNELLDDLINATWKMEPTTGYAGAIQRVVNGLVLDQLMKLAADQNASTEVRAIALLKLHTLEEFLASRESQLHDVDWRAESFFARNQIDLFEKNPAEMHVPIPATPPLGDPIGSDDWN